MSYPSLSRAAAVSDGGWLGEGLGQAGTGNLIDLEIVVDVDLGSDDATESAAAELRP